MYKKILFAVGGTGGHLLPAQALARELKEKHQSLEILFGGGRLSTNPFFHQMLFPFREIRSSSPFRSNLFVSIITLSQGVRQSLSLFNDFPPDLIVGFGSFYSFPLLAAARLKKIPYLLVESNAYPGKVNRLFASNALLCAIQFEEASQILKGKTEMTKIPFWAQEKETLSTHQARKEFGLDPDVFTLLIFGGSQGAEAINAAASSLKLNFPFQVIHLTGKTKGIEKIYTERGIQAYVRPFETRMDLAYRACDLAICRAGAGTLCELIEFEVPAILIPWPGASDQHQTKNARVISAWGGARVLEQDQLNQLGFEVDEAKQELTSMKRALHQLKHSSEIQSLSTLVLNQLEKIGSS